MHTLEPNFLQNEEQIEKFVKLVIKSLKVLTHEFLVGIGAWLAPACLRFSWGFAFLALPSAPPSFSGDAQRLQRGSCQILFYKVNCQEHR